MNNIPLDWEATKERSSLRAINRFEKEIKQWLEEQERLLWELYQRRTSI